MKAKEIAAELQVSMATVKKDLAEARRNDLIFAAREKLTNLLPKALAALEAHLEMGDKDVAIIILEGLGLLGKNVQVQMMTPAASGEDSIDRFRARVCRKVEPQVEIIASAIPEVEGSIVVEPLIAKALPPLTLEAT